MIRLLPMGGMSGSNGLSTVGVEIAEPRKRPPDWLHIAIGINVAILIHAPIFLLPAFLQKSRSEFVGHSVITSPAFENEMSWINPRPVLTILAGPHLAIPVDIKQWPNHPSAARLANLKIKNPEDEDEDEFGLMTCFGPSMEF